MKANLASVSGHSIRVPAWPLRTPNHMPSPSALAEAALGAQLLTDFVHGEAWSSISRHHGLRMRQAMGLARMVLAYGPPMARGPVPWTVQRDMPWQFTEAAITGDGHCLGVLTLYVSRTDAVLAPVGFVGDSPLDATLVGQPWHLNEKNTDHEQSLSMIETILWSGLYAVGYWEKVPQSPLAAVSAARSSVSLTNNA